MMERTANYSPTSIEYILRILAKILAVSISQTDALLKS